MRAILVLLGLSLGQFAVGYSAAPPQSFAKPTADGKHVLVMLRTKIDGDSREPNPVERKYDSSGLYPITDAKKPVWTCDWSADWPRTVAAANDAVHAVRVPDSDPGYRRWVLDIQNKRDGLPPKPADLESQPAVFLYKSGKPFKTLTFGEVFDCSRLTAADCFMGPVVTLEQLDEAAGRAYLHVHGERGHQHAVLDFRTGQVVSAGKLLPPDRCGNDGDEPSGVSDLVDDLTGAGLPVGRRIGYGLLILLVAVATGFGAFALVTIWRRRDTDGSSSVPR